jgi:sialidase-1
MKYQAVFLSILILLPFTVHAQESTAVFISGTDGHKTYRIPAIISMPDGKLLAFAEGRVNGSSDYGDINIVFRRSDDKGITWGPVSTVVDYDKFQAGNPAPVVDLTDPQYPGGRIFLFYNTGNNSENEVRKGNGIREVWYKASSDCGISWSGPVNITTMVHHPKQPGINKAYNFTDDWRSYANTPGHAIQFTEGRYKGRIFVAANHSKGDPLKNWDDYASHGYYTDDHGKTFHLSQTLAIPGSNEATAAEISGNGLILNARNQKGDIKSRIVAYSKDGGETWDRIRIDDNLPDPVCEGSILSLGQNEGRFILAFCNAASTGKRDNLTLRISYNEGETWPMAFPVDKSPDPRNSDDYAAYSDIVNVSASEIGILYERDNYSEIVFKVIKWK